MSQQRPEQHTVGALPPMSSLPVFEAVGRHLSIARAAEELHVTPGAISRQIRNLEAFVNCRLFERAHRRITFTPAGESLWADVSEAMAQLRDATYRLTSASGQRPLQVSCPRMFLQKRIVPVLGSLYARHPDISVRFVVALPGAVAEGLDVGIVVGDYTVPRGYRHERLVEGDLMPVCSPAYLTKAPPLDQPADLARHVLLRSTEYTRNWHRWLGDDADRVFATARFIDFDSSGLELPAAIEGLGISITRHSLVREELAGGTLVALFPDHAVRDHYAFVYPDNRRNSPAFRILRRWLHATLAEA
ncbi:hypothetical protein DLJ53_31030 [Acuticoccus sediminis]|uniref:HTH lysR-type domain-containing protein n=1 Tax=Acuticoccus sediminis TaxID=2184697 RepID=A0A8B2NI35_9HYPH|nr:LysR substrate-binding domain-containing protein [Acuticoccus sediminis]RAH96701.1 hypothetical protein DLJ53_31030 [Acuticoccus sediminis]